MIVPLSKGQQQVSKENGIDTLVLNAYPELYSYRKQDWIGSLWLDQENSAVVPALLISIKLLRNSVNFN